MKPLGARFGALDAIFFDFDGVLAESADIKTAAFRELYKDCGDDVLAAVLAHHRAHGGVSRIQKIRYCHRELLGIDVDHDEVAMLGRRFSRLVVDAVVESDWVDGARELLDALVGRRPLFVVSGTPEPELRDIIARRNMTEYFTVVRGSPPDKVTVIRTLLADHGLAAERVLFIGDAMTDYDAAQETGLRFIGRVPPDEASPFPEATTIVPDLRHLPI
ncbi:MAG: HAD family hydrolase [Rhodospirillales bacterium]|nr:HAD family hydrolase [Rhodospirillales bacterium]